MNLLTISEYLNFLQAEFSSAELGLIDDLILHPHQLADDEVQRTAHLLGLAKFPESFADMVSRFDFGNFSVINTCFGTGDTGSLGWLLRLNDPTAFGLRDFIEEIRQASLLLIANGDPFAILLDVATGSITALSSEETIATQLPAAASFHHFIVGMCTADKAIRSNELAAFHVLAHQEFGEAAIPFWRQLTNC